MMVCEAEYITVDVRAAHIAIETCSTTVEGDHSVERLVQFIVVLPGDVEERLILNVLDKGDFEILGIFAGDVDEVLHVDFVQRHMLWDSIVFILEHALVHYEVASGIVCAFNNHNALVVIVPVTDGNLLEFSVLDVDTDFIRLEPFQ